MTSDTPVRVLVVDDSVVARRLVARRLEKDDGFEVIGTASSGQAALERVRRDPPDVVVLDEEMPDMRGRDVLKVLRKEHPTCAVVMFSAHVGHGTQARFEAMMLGADDAVAKPTASSGRGGLDDDHPTWLELLSKLEHAARREERGGAPAGVARGVAERDRATRPVQPPASAAPVVRPRPPRNERAPARSSDTGVCVIASSTGGPDALAVLFEALPVDFPLPILIAQHMPPVFTKLLAKRLDKGSSLTVAESAGGERLQTGMAYIAPGDHHLVIRSRPVGCETLLDVGPPENSCRPAADVLFRSAAAAFGERVVACVLSGMGQDGMLGAIEIHDAGGTVFAQDEESCVVWGMPGAVVGAGVADHVMPLEEIAAAMTVEARAVVARSKRAGRVVS